MERAKIKVQCVNRHFFDASRFSKCPICGAEMDEQDKKGLAQQVLPAETAENAPQLQSTPQRPQESASPANASHPHEAPRGPDATTGHSEPPSIKPEQPPRKQSGPGKTTGGIPKFSRGGDLTPAPMLQPEKTAFIKEETREKPAPSREAPPEQPAPSREAPPEQQQTVHATLRDAVDATASTSVSPLPKTVAYYETDPPVGWLVCIKGFYLGKAYPFQAGRNRIGRNPDMEICLLEEQTIARDTQASILYEPKHRRYHLQAGTGRSLTSLNEETVFDHAELHAYDKIELGQAEFVFLPLCGEEFTWDDYI